MDSDTSARILLAIIASGPGIVAAIFSGIAMVLGLRNRSALADQKDKITEVHLALDGRLEQLLKASGLTGELKGRADARAEAIAEEDRQERLENLGQ